MARIVSETAAGYIVEHIEHTSTGPRRRYFHATRLLLADGSESFRACPAPSVSRSFDAAGSLDRLAARTTLVSRSTAYRHRDEATRTHQPDPRTARPAVRHVHRPRPSEATDRGFTAPVSASINQAAHGGITRCDVCACGVRRLTNINGSHIERGPWSRL